MILLKIIGVFWLSICSMNSYGSNESSLSVVSNSHENNSKYFIDIASSQYFLSSSDITWDKFYHGVLTDFDSAWSYEHNSDYLVNYDTTSNYAQVGNINVRYASTDQDGNALDVANWPVKNLYGLTITKDYVSPTWCNYTLEFYWKHNSSTTWTCKWFWRVYHDLEIDGSQSTGYVNIEQSYFFTSSNPDDNPIFYQFTLEFINAQNDYYMVRWFCRNDVSYSSGYNDGYNSGVQSGYNDGYNVGYSDGLSSSDSNPYMNSIFTGILEIGLLPVNVFLTILNFEVFGINISGLVSGFLTISIVIILIRFVLGGKNND